VRQTNEETDSLDASLVLRLFRGQSVRRKQSHKLVHFIIFSLVIVVSHRIRVRAAPDPCVCNGGLVSGGLCRLAVVPPHSDPEHEFDVIEHARTEEDNRLLLQASWYVGQMALKLLLFITVGFKEVNSCNVRRQILLLTQHQGQLCGRSALSWSTLTAAKTVLVAVPALAV